MQRSAGCARPSTTCGLPAVTTSAPTIPTPVSWPSRRRRKPSGAIPLKSPCACRLSCRPLLTPLVEWSLRLCQGAALHAQPVAVRSKALPGLPQLLRRCLTRGIESLGLCWGAREEFPRAWALSRARCKALVTRGPQPAATGITAAACEFVGGPRQARHVVAVQQARPSASADRVAVPAHRIGGGRDLGPPPHRVERGAPVSRDRRAAHR